MWNKELGIPERALSYPEAMVSEDSNHNAELIDSQVCGIKFQLVRGYSGLESCRP